MTVIADEPVIKTETRDRSLWIWINREARRNAINTEVVAGIERAVLSAQKNSSVRAIVLTGVGRKAFCAGADLTGGTDTFKRGLEDPMTDFGRLARVARNSGVPLIARINGDCVAGGMALMALCDLAVVSDHARFGLPEGKVGVFPMQVLVYLRRMLAPRHVNELCLTGDLIDAKRALEIGLANSVVGYKNLDATVGALAAKVAAMSPVALRRGKYAIAAMDNMGFAEALAFAETSISLVSLTDDAREGLAAFNERRPPRWTREPDSE